MHVSADRERSGTKPCGWRPMGLFVGAGQWGLSVGAGLPAIQAPRWVWHCAVMLSPASRLLQRVVANGPFCGSWLVSDSGTALGLALCGDAIAGKPAPTEGGGQWGLSVGGGLPGIQAPRRVWRCAVMLSPASRLLQRVVANGPFCGSWLVSDSGTAPGLALCGDAIAGKPAPTEGGDQWGLSVGAGLPAIQAQRRVWRCAGMLSPASRLLQRVATNGAFLWELACQRFRHRAVSGIVR